MQNLIKRSYISACEALNAFPSELTLHLNFKYSPNLVFNLFCVSVGQFYHVAVRNLWGHLLYLYSCNLINISHKPKTPKKWTDDHANFTSNCWTDNVSPYSRSNYEKWDKAQKILEWGTKRKCCTFQSNRFPYLIIIFISQV